jgi:DHA1 family bicyclomycin/chloramphenicol resistance-like MFS transporter
MKAETRGTSTEFIALVALTTSLVAMSIDTMLPALGSMATDLGARHPNDRQFILTAFLGGLTLGQLLYGPISDTFGRKLSLYSGIGLFVVAAVVCATTTHFPVLLAARALQGLGAASARVVSVAMVRDLHGGRAMARVMSFVSAIFILVPIVAPSVGQGILLVAKWRAIFWLLVAVALVDLSWLAIRQPETLPLSARARFSPGPILRAVAETFKNRVTLGYMLASGIVFGAFINYLTTSQQIFQEQYRLGRWFPICFGALALSIGLASFTNGKLVMRFGMRRLSKWALRAECVLASAFLAVAVQQRGHPPLPVFMAFMLLCFFCNGILFGNYNARAMEPMGHIAGVAAAVVGSGSSLVSLLVGTLFGRAYDGTITPLVSGFAVLGIAALVVTEYAERGAVVLSAEPPE